MQPFEPSRQMTQASCKSVLHASVVSGILFRNCPCIALSFHFPNPSVHLFLNSPLLTVSSVSKSSTVLEATNKLLCCIIKISPQSALLNPYTTLTAYQPTHTFRSWNMQTIIISFWVYYVVRCHNFSRGSVQ